MQLQPRLPHANTSQVRSMQVQGGPPSDTSPSELADTRYAADLGQAAQLSMANIRLTHQVRIC